MPDKIAGETIEREATSREGTVYITAKYVYKIFGGNTNPYDVLERFKTAEARGVPVPDTAKFTADLVNGTGTHSVSGIRMARASGTFFQLSKGGGEAALVNAIGSIANSQSAQKVLDGLLSAVALGVMDPQGFISPTGNPPLCFIDVHFRNSPNPIAFETAITAAKVQVQRLSG
jgi:hypothetical protein